MPAAPQVATLAAPATHSEMAGLHTHTHPFIEMAAGTLYLYFKGKERLFYALMEEGMNSLYQHLKSSIAREREWSHKFRLFIQIPFQFFEENRDFYQIYLRELPACSSIEERESKKRFLQGGG